MESGPGSLHSWSTPYSLPGRHEVWVWLCPSKLSTRGPYASFSFSSPSHVSRVNLLPFPGPCGVRERLLDILIHFSHKSLPGLRDKDTVPGRYYVVMLVVFVPAAKSDVYLNQPPSWWWDLIADGYSNPPARIELMQERSNNYIGFLTGHKSPG